MLEIGIHTTFLLFFLLDKKIPLIVREPFQFKINDLITVMKKAFCPKMAHKPFSEQYFFGGGELLDVPTPNIIASKSQSYTLYYVGLAMTMLKN